VVDRLQIPGFLVGAEIAAGVPSVRKTAACCLHLIRQFRRPGNLQRRAQADALIAAGFLSCPRWRGRHP
jgi:hypothetical protein